MSKRTTIRVTNDQQAEWLLPPFDPGEPTCTEGYPQVFALLLKEARRISAQHPGKSVRATVRIIE